MVKEFDAQLHKGDNPGAWTCVVLDDVAQLFGTRGLVKIRGAIDGQPFDGALMAQGDGTHRLPVRAQLRKAIGKEAGDTVHVRIEERVGWGPEHYSCSAASPRCEAALSRSIAAWSDASTASVRSSAPVSLPSR